MVIWRALATLDRRACFAMGNLVKCGKCVKSV
jgi:hypothetical protein